MKPLSHPPFVFSSLHPASVSFTFAFFSFMTLRLMTTTLVLVAINTYNVLSITDSKL